MNNKEQILDLFYNENLKQCEIVKQLNLSKQYVSKIVRADKKYTEIKEFRKILISLPSQITYIPHQLFFRNVAVRSRINFGTVAGRKNQKFVKSFLFKCGSLDIHRDVELLAYRDFGHLVAHACHVNFAHGDNLEN